MVGEEVPSNKIGDGWDILITDANRNELIREGCVKTNMQFRNLKYTNGLRVCVYRSVCWTGPWYYRYSVRVTARPGKSAQPMTVKAKSPKVKKSVVKKKKQTIAKAKAFTIKNAQGSVTFKKTGGSKRLTISKSGKITVKKGTKKGTYKIKVKVTASGNGSYKAGSKTVTVKVRVA